MYKIRLLLIICFSVLYGDDITSSCKDFDHQQCLIDGWKFENTNHRDALKNYTKAKDFKDKNSFVKSYKHIIKARDIVKKEQILKTKMKKNIYTGSALRNGEKVDVKVTVPIKFLIEWKKKKYRVGMNAGNMKQTE